MTGRSFARALVASLGFMLAACAAATGHDDSKIEADAPAAAVAPHAPDPAAGLALAQGKCVACHAIAPGETQSPNPAAPAFAVVANTPGVTPIALNVWLHSEHPSMPNVEFVQSDADNVIAYIFTLRRSE